MALPYHPKDWFSHLQTTKYQQLMHDLFDGVSTTSPAAQDSHGATKTRRKALARNADVLVGISTS
jgi:hypothetical protein